jgi:hypothetical protein
MPAIVPFLLVSVILAAIAIVQSRRQHRPGKVQSVAAAPASGRRMGTLTRRGRVGDAQLGAPVRSTVAIAPGDSPATALDLLASDGTELAHVNVSDAIMVRGWSKGHLVIAFGEARRDYGPSWGLGPALAGWEIHLVTATGEVLRCYGGPGSSADDDLARLRTRIQGAALAQAS